MEDMIRFFLTLFGHAVLCDIHKPRAGALTHFRGTMDAKRKGTTHLPQIATRLKTHFLATLKNR